jgi:hypothetical protein
MTLSQLPSSDGTSSGNKMNASQVQGAEDITWTEEGRSDRKMEKLLELHKFTLHRVLLLRRLNQGG